MTRDYIILKEGSRRTSEISMLEWRCKRALRNGMLVLSRSQVTASWNLRGKGFACAAPAAGGCPWVPERFRGTIVRSLASLRTNLLEIFGEAADSIACLLPSFACLLARLLSCACFLNMFHQRLISTLNLKKRQPAC